MTPPVPYLHLKDNLGDVDRLLEIHTQLTGDERGRRFGVAVLNRSAIVLTTACWEAFIEDLAEAAFDFVLANALEWSAIPSKVRVSASRSLRHHVDESRVWDLAGLGWQAVLQQHKAATIRDFIGQFNTPKADKVNHLFQSLLDLRHLSNTWRWQKMPVGEASERLDMFVTLRGAIAHRLSPDTVVTKKNVTDYRRLVRQLAVKSSNAVRAHIHGLVHAYPWDSIRF
jgi:hypothetical protein